MAGRTNRRSDDLGDAAALRAEMARTRADLAEKLALLKGRVLGTDSPTTHRGTTNMPQKNAGQRSTAARPGGKAKSAPAKEAKSVHRGGNSSAKKKAAGRKGGAATSAARAKKASAGKSAARTKRSAAGKSAARKRRTPTLATTAKKAVETVLTRAAAGALAGAVEGAVEATAQAVQPMLASEQSQGGSEKREGDGSQRQEGGQASHATSGASAGGGTPNP
jgi:hypothetical protein